MKRKNKKPSVTPKLNAKFIKLQLMKYFRFDRGYIFVCTEGINKSDINALDKNSLIEVEVKISKSDFLREFDGKSRIKSYKHKVLQGLIKPRKGYIVPNYYMFCVTPELESFAIEYLKQYPNYGLLVCGEKRVFNKRSHIFSVKKAKKIHSTPPSDTVFYKIGQRVQSELITLREKLDNLKL